MWHFRGAPHYLDLQGKRLGVPKVITDRARTNPQIHRVGVLLGQLCERWHRLPRDEDGDVAIGGPELAQVKGTLAHAEEECQKLHVLAAVAQTTIDEAYRAFNQSPPDRSYRVRCDFDEPPHADTIAIRLSGRRAHIEHEHEKDSHAIRTS